jgi:hypothetical protein
MVDRVSPLQSTCVAEVVHEHVDPHPLVEVSSDQSPALTVPAVLPH